MSEQDPPQMVTPPNHLAQDSQPGASTPVTEKAAPSRTAPVRSVSRPTTPTSDGGKKITEGFRREQINRSRRPSQSRFSTLSQTSEKSTARGSLHHIREVGEKREHVKQVKVVESTTNDLRIFRGQHREFDKMDETSKFLMSVPKTLPNQVDAKTKERLCEEQARLETEIELHRESQAIRHDILLVKQQTFRNAIKRFDHFIEDMEKKELRAREQCRRLRVERLELTIKLRSLKKMVGSLQKERDHLFKTIHALANYAEFMLATVKASDGQYKTPESLVDRYAALTKSSKRLMCRYNYNNERLEALRDMNDALAKTTIENVLDMRNKITILKNRLTQVTEHAHEQYKYFESVRERFVEKDIENADIKLSIMNIVNVVTNFRPFTHHRMVAQPDLVSQVEKIGEIMLDYEQITAELNSKAASEKTAGQKRRRSKAVTSKPESGLDSTELPTPQSEVV